MINKNSKIYLAGHTGLVGSAVLRYLKKQKYKKIFLKKKKDLDLRNQYDTFKFLNKIKPDAVIICAAKVGGIKANSEYSGEFIYDNLCIQNNLIHGSYKNSVKNLIFLGSSCVYPKFSKQPIKEKYLLSNYLEETNAAYAVAKIAGIKLIENYKKQYNLNYKCLMPCNLFGPNDNYNLDTSHFIPATISKIHTAKLNHEKKVYFWGDGTPLREVMYVDHLARAIIFFLKKNTKDYLINIGSGYEKRIFQFINIIKKQINCDAKIIFNKEKILNGVPKKILDCSIARKYGFRIRSDILRELKITYKSFLKNL